jgi:hypothetical protein
MIEPVCSFPLIPVAPADAQHSRRGEASLAALRDGGVLLVYGRFTGRNDSGYHALAATRAQRYQGSYIERDNDYGGETWSAPRSLEVISPSAPAHLSRLPGTNDLLLVWTPNYDARAPMNGHRHTLMACVSTDGGRSWPHSRRKILVHDPSCNTDYPAVLHRGDEVWIAVRQSDHPTVIQGRMSTCLMRVPTRWLYS